MAKKVTSTVKLYPHAIKKLTDAQVKALEQTAEALHQDVVDSRVIPRDTGHLHKESTFVDYSQSKNGTVSLVSQTPYARRLYYHPEYNFRKTENPNAQGKWLEPWISGEKKDFCKDTYGKIYKQLGGV
jgi:NAD+--asparagine ADP-ribosyltransferase